MKTRAELPGFALLTCLLVGTGVVGVVAWRVGARGELAAGPAKTTPLAEISTSPVLPPAPPRPRPAIGSVLGRFEVPALKMAWTVLEGTDDKTLERSVGHVEGTALLGEPGNIGLAAHRNTHFRKIEWIRLGDEIVLTSQDGTFRYRVNYLKMQNPKTSMSWIPHTGRRSP